MATATTAAPGDLASGLLPVPAWLIAAVALVVAGVGLAWLLHRRRKARRGPAR